MPRCAGHGIYDKLLRSRRMVTIVLAAVAVAVLVCFYVWVDPASTPMPQCLFRRLTGWQCPGCGSQRALHALLHGHLLEAWRYNLLLPFLLVLAVAYFAAPVWRRRLPRLHAFLLSPPFIWALLLVVIAFTLLRNLLSKAI